ncbi:MAG TPA: D-alanyl-D-alanine carboxypeptidase/D-alanyl-D-alanine-endopeptidase [Pseudonocardiaceae bacterium]
MIGRIRLLPVALAGVLLVGGLSAAAPGSAAAGPTGQDALVSDLDRILSDQRLRGAQVGVVVRDATTGDVLYNRGGQQRLLPASNGKILTSIAALEALGPDHRFTTTVLADGQQRGSALLGDLYLKGTGDPTLMAADLDRLAAQVAATGIRTVQGRLVADDTWFDRTRLGVSWAWDDEPYYYSAQISALTLSPNTDFDSGTVLVRVAPGTEGGPATVTLEPATDYVHVDNRVVTGAPGSATGVSVEREHGSNTVVVTGSVAADASPVEDLATVWEPAGYAADVFRRALVAHGVRIVHPDTGLGAAPEGARVVAEHRSMPLSELLVPFMKLSNNGHAEILVKTMGRVVHGEGSWDAGVRVMQDKLAALGLPPGTYRMVDGSGLSRMDMLSAEQVSALLVEVRDEPWFPSWYASLPVAGEPDRMVGGTLRSRMRDTPAAGNVVAKTGSMTGVTALSGYVTAANGQPLVFSVLLNNHLSPNPKDIEDAVAVRLATYRGGEDTAGQVERMVLRPAPLPADDPTTRVNEADLECSWVGAC